MTDPHYDEALKTYERIQRLAEEIEPTHGNLIERACVRAESITFRIKRTGKVTDSELRDLKVIAEELYKRKHGHFIWN